MVVAAFFLSLLIALFFPANVSNWIVFYAKTALNSPLIDHRSSLKPGYRAPGVEVEFDGSSIFCAFGFFGFKRR